ncbi:MAG: hypothetical protein ACK4ND_18505 [Cytophagaceae bacterium]
MNIQFLKQIQFLKSVGKQLISEIDNANKNRFYFRLKEYIIYYNENVPLLLEAYKNNTLIAERLKLLPKLEFRGPGYFPSSETPVYLFFRIIFPPLLILDIIRQYRYISSTKAKLQDIVSVFSSIEFIFEGQENELNPLSEDQ